MKSLLAVTALSLSASFATPVFAQATPSAGQVISECVQNPSACASLIASLNLNTLPAGVRAQFSQELRAAVAVVAARNPQVVAQNPGLVTSVNTLSDAIETATVTESIAESFTVSVATSANNGTVTTESITQIAEAIDSGSISSESIEDLAAAIETNTAVDEEIVAEFASPA